MGERYIPTQLTAKYIGDRILGRAGGGGGRLGRMKRGGV